MSKVTVKTAKTYNVELTEKEFGALSVLLGHGITSRTMDTMGLSDLWRSMEKLDSYSYGRALKFQRDNGYSITDLTDVKRLTND